MQTAYITRKVFADGSDETRIKINHYITKQTTKRALITREKNKIKRNARKLRLERELKNLRLTDEQYARKHRIIEHELQLRNIQNICRSAHRSRQNLYDICRCNEFSYFVTWTFDKDKIDRLDDEKVKRKFTQFQNYLRKKFPDMFYIAVPEYHKKGGLHFHLLIGGVTMDELKAAPAVYSKSKGRHKKGDYIFKNGKQIFNVARWKSGYSTLSVIANGEASKHYICKYITKQHYDDRFFGKRRYYVSNNIARPAVEKCTTAPEHCLDNIDFNVHKVSYADISKKYAVFTSDGNGIVNTELNSDSTKQRVKTLSSPTKSADGCEWLAAATAAPSGGCPYSTLRTLDSVSSAGLSFSPLWLFSLSSLYRENAITDEDFCREIGLID